MNNDVLPFFDEHRRSEVKTVLSDNGREFDAAAPDRHPYELFLQLEDIEHRIDEGWAGPSPTASSSASTARSSTST